MNDAQLVGENWTVGSFGQEVVHQSKERCRQKERHGVVTIPPLHESILNTCVNRVALDRQGLSFGEPRADDRYDNVVEHVQHSH